MSDPFDALRVPDTPEHPDPGFAADLRERLRRAVLTWKDDTTMTTSTQTQAGAGPAISPYIVVADAAAAIDWYVEALNAHRRGEPVVMPDGAIGHAELTIGDAVLMLADAAAAGDTPVAAPEQGRPASHTLHLRVPDVDAAFARAVDRGARPERDPADYPYGRLAVLVDPFGHRWMLAEDETAPRPGDIGYATVVVADADAARAFYGAVLGWSFSPGSVPGGWQVNGRQVGLWGGGGSPRVDLCYRVADIRAAVDAVRAHGGTAGEIDTKPYGRYVECADPEGTAFQLWQP
ncbi:VOC family protein [Actinokineospora fastidiosa]|uniref:Glyoxalase n=1 Tax=Actinokineospora fastidiosa TaxID=1816 RepID=A0A918GB33_9PSEU|nr:VOC family protein [Actinokineospora fastidiosa]GGS28073.1 glyoxalase [Actinokineospora fastidiosa]